MSASAVRNLLGLLVAGLIVVAAPAYGGTDTEVYTIPFDHSESGIFGEDGEVVALGSVDIDAEHQGLQCAASVTLTNDSRWPETNLFLDSDGTSVQLLDAEDEKGTFTVEMGTLTLGPTATALLQFGPGGASSIMGVFTIDCTDAPGPLPPNPCSNFEPCPRPPETPTATETPAPPAAAPPIVNRPRFTG
jgi:hypothetical protein